MAYDSQEEEFDLYGVLCDDTNDPSYDAGPFRGDPVMEFDPGEELLNEQCIIDVVVAYDLPKVGV